METNNRNTALIALRPALNLEQIASTETEQFQNNTLRPILKLQNPLLLLIFWQYVEKRKNTFGRMDKIDKARYIEHSIKTDNRFKNTLIGMVIGLFSEDEFVFYQKNDLELNRRIAEMIIQRLQSQCAL